MRTNRKGLLSGYTDLQFSALLVVLLLLFGILMYTNNQSTQAEVLHERIAWEHGWLANAIANHPVPGSDQALGEALAQNLPAERAQPIIDGILDRTGLHEQSVAVFVLRGGELIYCDQKLSVSNPNLRDGFPCSRALINSAAPTPIEEAVSANLGVGLLDARAQRLATARALSWSVTPGKNQTVIGVVTS